MVIRRIRSHHRFMWRYTLALFRTYKRPAFVFLCFASATFIFTGSAVFHWLESAVNPKVHGLLDSVYFVVTTMTGVGYGDIVPVSAPGKLFAIATMLLGTAFYVSFTAVIASSLVEFELEDSEFEDGKPAG